MTHPSDIENASELLTRPGTWYADFWGGLIYYMPRPGETPATILAVLGTVEPPTPPPGSDAAVAGPAAIRVVPGAQRLRFTGLTVQFVSWLKPSGPGGFVDLQSGYYYTIGPNNSRGILVGVPGTMWLTGVKDVVVDSCTFTNLGLSGVSRCPCAHLCVSLRSNSHPASSTPTTPLLCPHRTHLPSRMLLPICRLR